jgi:hypothetical protein
MPLNELQPDEYISLQKLAARWDLSDRTVRRIPDVELPASMIAGSVRYRGSEVLKYEDLARARRRSSTSE